MASGHRVPHQQAAHMAAPTEGQNINKALANGEPSTHGAKRTLANFAFQSGTLIVRYLPLAHPVALPAMSMFLSQRIVRAIVPL